NKETTMKIQGKVFVVTGAGSGIGRSLTLAMLKGGAKVAAVDINEANLKETASLANAGTSLSTHVVDISNRQQIEALRPAVVEAHGVVASVVHSAGIIQPSIPLQDLRYGAIERELNINLYGTLYMVKTFLPGPIKRPEAHIVKVSSMGGFLPFP